MSDPTAPILSTPSILEPATTQAETSAPKASKKQFQRFTRPSLRGRAAVMSSRESESSDWTRLEDGPAEPIEMGEAVYNVEDLKITEHHIEVSQWGLPYTEREAVRPA